MTTYPNMNLTLPTRGAPGSGHWADVLDVNLANIDNHNHSGSGRGLQLGASALAIDGDVSFNTSWAVTALNRTTYASVPPPGVNKSTWVADGTGGTTAGELYWTSALGANVKMTNAGTLNVGAFVGGIGGDYQSVGAQLNYDDSAKRYTLKEGTVDSNHWARAACGGLRLFEFNTGNSVYVEQLCPAGIAGTYAITWPLALPGSQVLQQVDATGQVIWSNTLANNANLTLAGTGEVKHGNRTLAIMGCHGVAQGNPADIIYDATNGAILFSASDSALFSVPLKQGDRPQSVTFARFGNASANITAANLIKVTAAGVATTLATTSVAVPAASWNDTTMTVGAPVALAAGEGLFIAIFASASGIRLNNLRTVYDRP